jgi:ankyrin repeat protein
MVMAEVNEFFAAIGAGDVGLVRAMLDGNPDLVTESGADGASASLTALYNGHAPLADELAARTGELSVFEAAAFDDTARLNQLVEADHGIVETWSEDGWQPLHLAAFFGRVEAARVLLDADAPVAETSRNSIGVQPLHAASAGQHSEIVWLLIASDAPVNAAQQHGWRPIHSAAHNGDVESIKALLSAHADPRQPNDDGKTALDLAPNEAVRALLEAASGSGPGS